MQMGHAKVQITLDRYSHLLQDSHPAQAAKLSSLVFGDSVSPGNHGAQGALGVPSGRAVSGAVVVPEHPQEPQNSPQHEAKSRLN